MNQAIYGRIASRQTAKLPQLARAVVGDRSSAIRNLQEEMAFGIRPDSKAAQEIGVRPDSEVVEAYGESQEYHSQRRFRFDFTSIVGRRVSQEDAETVHQDGRYQLVCVFDGHGGDSCSQFCAATVVDVLQRELRQTENSRQALFQTCIKLDQQFARVGDNTVGCTATMALVDWVNKCVTIANVGDSKTMVGFHLQSQSLAQTIQPVKNYPITRPGSKQLMFNSTLSPPQQKTVAATQDHKPNTAQEMARLRKNFPQTRVTTFMGVSRVDGQLSLSRAIGDIYMKPSGIIAEPDLYEYSLDNTEYVLLACDGLFDVFTVGEVDDMVRTMLLLKRVSSHNTRILLLDICLAYCKNNAAEGDKLLGQLSGQRVYKSNACEEVTPGASLSKRITQILTRMAYWKGSMDNITCIMGVLE